MLCIIVRTATISYTDKLRTTSFSIVHYSAKNAENFLYGIKTIFTILRNII